MDDSGILDEERPDPLSLGIELRISDRKSSALTTDPRLPVKNQSPQNQWKSVIE